MDQKTLIKLLMILKKNNVTFYKDKDIELRLDSTNSIERGKIVDPVAPPIYTTEDLAQQKYASFTPSITPDDQRMTEEDFLYYSSGYDPKQEKLNDPEAK